MKQTIYQNCKFSEQIVILLSVFCFNLRNVSLVRLVGAGMDSSPPPPMTLIAGLEVIEDGWMNTNWY